MLGIWNSPPVPSLHAFTRERRRGRAGNRSRMRGSVVNRDRRRAFRATLTRQRRGCKQAESHAREFDGDCSWFSRLSAHRWEEEREGGMGVTWRKHDKHVVHRHAISYPVEMHPSPLLSLPFVFVRPCEKERVSYGVLMLLNQFERIFIVTLPLRFLKFRLEYFSSELYFYFYSQWNNFNVTRVLVFLPGCPTAYWFILLRLCRWIIFLA